MKTLVIGAGVSGLTTAVRLCEMGCKVHIVTREAPLATTSAVSAALWFPYKAYPLEAVTRWMQASLAKFQSLATNSRTGVVLTDGAELFRAGMVPEAEWRSALPGFRVAADAWLRGGAGGGFCFRLPIIEMPIYLRYLQNRYFALGGTYEEGVIGSLEEALARAPLVINCSGLGARELARDDTVMPIRGQIVRLARAAGIKAFWLDDTLDPEPTYIIPRSRDVIVGGTAEEGADSLTPDPQTAERILARAALLEPRLAGQQILEHKVGLRPGRPAVRVEAVKAPGGRMVIHNYGHGGSGVTLSWGTAEEVARLAQPILSREA